MKFGVWIVSPRLRSIMSKTVLLTGGAGSIGVHVISHIMHNTDWKVINLDSFRHKGYNERLEYIFNDHPDWKDRFTNIQHDLTCPIPKDFNFNYFGIDYDNNLDIDYIIHLAAMSDVFFSVENPQYVIKNNIDSTLNLLEFARAYNPEAFIYFSTDEVYGAVSQPNEGHKEWDTHRPSNAYAASKAACEDICYAYWRSYDLPLIITNTMNNFGEMQSRSKFPVIIQNKITNNDTVTIHGNEKEIGSRYYIHSRNVADALLHILKIGAKRHKLGELDEPSRYHIVGDTCYNNLELAQKIAGLMNKKLKYEFVDFHKDNPAHDIHYGLQDNKLRASGWEQPVGTEESLKNTIKWQEENSEWIK